MQDKKKSGVACPPGERGEILVQHEVVLAMFDDTGTPFFTSSLGGQEVCITFSSACGMWVPCEPSH